MNSVFLAINNYVADLGLAGLARPQCLAKYLTDVGVLPADQAELISTLVADRWDDLQKNVQLQLTVLEGTCQENRHVARGHPSER